MLDAIYRHWCCRISLCPAFKTPTRQPQRTARATHHHPSSASSAYAGTAMHHAPWGDVCSVAHPPAGASEPIRHWGNTSEVSQHAVSEEGMLRTYFPPKFVMYASPWYHPEGRIVWYPSSVSHFATLSRAGAAIITDTPAARAARSHAA